MSDNVKSATGTVAVDKEPADLQQAVELLVEAHPYLADPQKLRAFHRVLDKYVAKRNLSNGPGRPLMSDVLAQAELDRAKKFTAFATTVSGAAAAGGVTVSIVPNAPWIVLGATLIGLVASRVLTRKLQELDHERYQVRPRSPV